MSGVRFHVKFFKTTPGSEPVREWLKSLDQSDRKTIGEDIKTVQFGWPLGMPLIRKLEADMWEVRSSLKSRIARVIFTVHRDKMILLHGFIKKSQKTPAADLKIARQRLSQFREDAS
ncbi:MAG: type II toxin-antitoxin system RelE/ParE family toxin [Planctomycetota bacterium]|nr:type II toxin-antitoxin system RelE/ParE family toxin [Planctomycetota bacterium]